MRVQPRFLLYPAHHASQPSLPAGTAGPVHLDQFDYNQLLAMVVSMERPDLELLKVKHYITQLFNNQKIDFFFGPSLFWLIRGNVM